MTSWGRLSQRAVAAATALLLQAALYLALSPRNPSLPRLGNEPRLIAMILAATRAKRRAPPRVHAREHLMPIAVVAQHPLVGPLTAAEPQQHSSRSAIDWEAALQREVRTQETRAHAPAKLRFGFPEMPAVQGPHSPFSWNENRLNRVQRLVHGIIDLGDNCFIVLWLPIPQCHSDSGDDDLFAHMHDPKPPEGPNTLP